MGVGDASLCLNAPPGQCLTEPRERAGKRSPRHRLHCRLHRGLMNDAVAMQHCRDVRAGVGVPRRFARLVEVVQDAIAR